MSENEDLKVDSVASKDVADYFSNSDTQPVTPSPAVEKSKRYVITPDAVTQEEN